MSDRPERLKPPRSSRQRYRQFVEDYKRRRLDDEADDLRRMGQRAARQATDYLEDQLKQGKKKLNEVVSR